MIPNLRDRIIELRRVPANELRANPNNYRLHGDRQMKALKAVLSEIGFAGAALTRLLPDGSLELIDAHARQKLTGTAPIPVLVTDLTAEESLKLLAVFDPIGAMAGKDQAKYDALAGLFTSEDAALRDLVDSGKTSEGPPPDWKEKFEILAEFPTEAEQAQYLEKMAFDGVSCRSLITPSPPSDQPAPIAPGRPRRHDGANVAIVRESRVSLSARVRQLSGLFDLQTADVSRAEWDFALDIDAAAWRIGLITGPSGSGKTTVARHLWPTFIAEGYEWPDSASVVDGFPTETSIQEITGALSSVGFSTPPAWVRPFGVLSNGEQWRATLARALLDPRPLVVMDEFSSVVDRTVAQVGSAAVARAVRRLPGRQFVAVTCHADVEEWLCPDWVLSMPDGTLTRRSLRRPPIELDVARVNPSAWSLFRRHHYLDSSLHRSAYCFVAFWRGRPVAFASALHTPGRYSYWREHRTVCLPDFQGVGIGNRLSEFVAGVMLATGKRYMSTTGNPAMIRHRARSPLWKLRRAPSRKGLDYGKRAVDTDRADWVGSASTRAVDRLTAGFEFVGESRRPEALRFGVLERRVGRPPGRNA